MYNPGTDELKTYMETAETVNLESVILAEWNLNMSDNIDKVGNYRYRPETVNPTESNFGVVKQSWVEETSTSPTKYYFGATDSDITIISGLYEEDQTPIAFTTKNNMEKQLFSLDDCLGRFRPRSGINKLRYLGGPGLSFGHNLSSEFANRPRYYIASSKDRFKYWDSYREETVGAITKTYGKSSTRLVDSQSNIQYFMTDAAPFVKYTSAVPANRLVVKMQTNVGDYNSGDYVDNFTNDVLPDRLYADPTDKFPAMSTTPIRWRVQTLKKDSGGNLVWTTQKTFDENSLRANGNRVIGSDGYVELCWGIVNVPAKYATNFQHINEISSDKLLPAIATTGQAYLLSDSSNITSGIYYVWNGGSYDQFSPQYGWSLMDETLSNNPGMSILKNLTTPSYYGNSTVEFKSNTYRDFDYMYGIRIIVDTMVRRDATFSLIEMSPRLVADLSEKATSFSITKSASDIANSGIPAGELIASTGQLDLFDYDEAFSLRNPYNPADNPTGSVISDFSTKNLQIKFYEKIKGVGQNLNNYLVPIKTMYSEGFPNINNQERKITLTLRDLFFYFESLQAPQLLLRNVTVSYAIAILLDSVGFSNYAFAKAHGEVDEIIPFFFIGPDTTVAQVLGKISSSTQTSIFFDEFNNLIAMSKDYMMPSKKANGDYERGYTVLGGADVKLYGDKYDSGEESKSPSNSVTPLANIMEIASEENKMFNGGKITYNNRYIQKSYGTLKEASLLNRDQSYIYKPVLLWEVSGTENMKSVNEEQSSSSTYTLSAIALNSDLTSEIPKMDEPVVKIKSGNGNGSYIEFVIDDTVTTPQQISSGDQVNITGMSNLNTTSGEWDTVAWVTETSFFIYSEKTGTVSPSTSGSATKPKQIVNNIIDFGQSVYWLSRYNGYFHSKGEIIRYDAVEYSVSKTPQVVSISSISGSNELQITLGNTDQLSVGDEITWLDESGMVASVAYVKEIPSRTSVKISKVALKTIESTNIRVTNKNVVAWVSSAEEYADHIARVPFGGKIYPTGRVRIYTEPSYDKDTKELSGVNKHGRGQFNTEIKYHSAGIDSEWTDSTTVNNVRMESDYIFTNKRYEQVAIELNKITGTKDTYVLTVPAGSINQETGKTPIQMIEVGFYVTNPSGGALATSSVPITVSQIDYTTGKITLSGKIKSDRDVAATDVFRFTKILDSEYSDLQPFTTTTKAGGNINTQDYTKVKASQSSIIRDFLSSSYATETDMAKAKTGKLPVGALQASALILTGNASNGVLRSADPTPVSIKPLDLVSYKYKDFATRVNGAVTKTEPHTHFGTRCRIIGGISVNSNDSEATRQFPYGASTIKSVVPNGSTEPVTVTGSSGGIAFRVNPNNNTGYYFEIVALSERSIPSPDPDGESVELNNVYFYKVLSGGISTDVNGTGIPIVLWSGMANILTDSGNFVGQSRKTGEQNPTVYDISVEVVDGPQSTATFNLYVNNRLIGVATDADAIGSTNNNNTVALFTRGNSKIMFENVFALSRIKSFDKTKTIESNLFTDTVNRASAFEKFSMNTAIQDLYLNQISPKVKNPEYNLWFEEFGAILRECAYMNIRYDKAFPAIYSKISPTFNDLQAYSVSGYTADAYGAEFMIFNTSDSVISLDETTGNYLRIQGITFTQQSSHELTVDEYFAKHADTSDASFNDKVYSSLQELETSFIKIKNSRSNYGINDFNIQGDYIQTQSAAESLMSWMIKKLMNKTKKNVGVRIFANPMIQLGDIVSIDYKPSNGISFTDSIFVVYNIKYERSPDGPSMTLYLSEVT